uniref:Uncharacterized protein n=1 Tax=Rhizophora mucronata TaxID=61149 RepID=A0A2P2IQ84_RHIMU
MPCCLDQITTQRLSISRTICKYLNWRARNLEIKDYL